MSAAGPQANVVLDTNIVLDLLVFEDPATPPLRQSLQQGALLWLATPAMRDELARVLAYPKIISRLSGRGIGANCVLAGFDGAARLVAVPARAFVTCRDADDQKFVDLAAAHRCLLLSKDRAVLCLRRKLAALSVAVDCSVAVG